MVPADPDRVPANTPIDPTGRRVILARWGRRM